MHEQNKNINKEKYRTYKKIEILELKTTITELKKIHKRDSTTDFSKQKKESVNFNANNLALSYIKNKKK